MKKAIEQAKKNSFMVVASTIQTEKQAFEFVFDEKECQALANRFELPKVLSFRAHLNIFRDEFVRLQGKFQAQVIYKSVISLEEFPSSLSEKFEVLFSEEPPAESEEIIDLIERGRIDLKEVLFEQFGLALNPFPKKPEEANSFIYQEDEEKNSPFQNLNQLLKK